MKKKILTLIALVIFIFTLVGCKAEMSDMVTNTDTTYESKEPVPTLSNIDIIRERYSDVDYERTEIRFLSISPGAFPYMNNLNPLENELYFEEESGDVLYDAIYRRNLMLEDMLNISLKPVWGGDPVSLNSALSKSVNAGDSEYDIVLNRLDYSLNNAAKTMLHNLMSVGKIELNDSWWNAKLIENFKISGDRLYVIAGDLNFYDDYATNLMIYNKRIADANNYSGFYDMVQDGKWVLEKLTKMCKETTVDLNGDGKMDEINDQWGMAESTDAILHFLYACGESMSHTDDNGEILLTYNERLVNIVDKIYSFVVESGNVNIGSTYGSMFIDGRKMFYYTGIAALPKLRIMEDDFGILPIPKWDEAQEEYLAYVSNGSTTCFSVPVTNVKLERALTVLDVMSAFSTDTVKAAIYENLMKQKYVRDDESLVMLDLYVFKAGVYDWAGDLEWSSKLRNNVYTKLITQPSNTFVSLFESNSEAVNKSLENFVGSFK